jgi:hypothetical protein
VPDSMRNCVRCGAELHMSAERQPHLCADKARRLKRQEAQVTAVCDVLYAHTTFAPGGDNLPLARDIVRALNRLGITQDA